MDLQDYLKEEIRRATQAVVEEQAVSKADRAGLEASDRGASITLEPGQELDPDDIPALLAYHGLNAEDWTVERVTANKWDAHSKINNEMVKSTNRQLKVALVPSAAKALGIVPARIDGPIYARPDIWPSPNGEYNEYVILPDQQIPHHDKPLHELACRWLDYNKPFGIICSGDVIDLPTVSKHRHNPHMVKEHDKAVQLGIDSTYTVLSNYVQASPSPYRKWIPGNHEERFQNYLIERAPALHGVKRAGQVDQHSAFSIPFLTQSDTLGFDWVTAPNGAEWPDAELILSPHLAIRHGWLAAKGSGMTALKTLQHLGYSVIVGHTHRQGLVFMTQREISGKSRTHMAIEAGTMAEQHEGLGYSIAPDWQQGFAVVRLFYDGTFTASLATYINGVLVWEGQRYSQDARGVKVAA